MNQHLVLTIRFHEPRFHGLPEWPPAPARVFQALVAGIARGSTLPEGATRALGWFESLPHPIIAAPPSRLGARVDQFVPNNDADAVGGDPNRVADIRSKKTVQPRLLDEPKLIYAWPISAESEHTSKLLDIANNLYQLGRGIDPAWALGELLDEETFAKRLDAYHGLVHRPSPLGNMPLLCPVTGSLKSLEWRHRANLDRLQAEQEGNAPRILFSQPPKPRFQPVGYESAPHRTIFELRARGMEFKDGDKLWPWRLDRVVQLVEHVRDSAKQRLGEALPEQVEAIERTLIGRKADGRDGGPIEQRVRILPLPSIGHQHADHAVRRVLVEVPGDCPLRPDDTRWAFSGGDPIDEMGFLLVESSESSLLDHYAPARGARCWQSVTAVALPEAARRRRIEPSRRAEEAKGATERVREETRAQEAVCTALRHAGIRQRVSSLHVQREPFHAHGARAEAFAEGARFEKHRLWHVRLTFDEPVSGPLLLGDGRFLGLGLLAPCQRAAGVFAFRIEQGLTSGASPLEVARALRRAVLSRVQEMQGPRKPLSKFVSGHQSDGAPVRDEPHLTFAFEPRSQRLLVMAPHIIERRNPTSAERRELTLLDQALTGFCQLRAGSAGRLLLRTASIDRASDPLFATSRVWDTATSYQATRHTKAGSADAALTADILAECRRHQLPTPRVIPRNLKGISGVGLVGDVRLEFDVAVRGPILLGKSRYLGGGLFVAASE